MKVMTKRHIGLFILSFTIMTMYSLNLAAQDGTTYMRIAKITVDSIMLDDYKAALKEQMQSALELEKGVLAYSALQERDKPSRITIFETYASVEAYQAHIQTAHFKKYKAAVVDMVKELELIDVVPIAIQSKPKNK